MKWYENGIVFNGTPAEFAELHSILANAATPVAAEQCRKQRVIIQPMHGRGCTITAPNGESTDFVSVVVAWRYFVAETGVNVSYAAFHNAACNKSEISGYKLDAHGEKRCAAKAAEKMEAVQA